MKHPSFLWRLFSASTLLLALVASAQSMAVDLSVVAVTKISEKRLTRTEYEYVMSVTVKNGAQPLTNASETLTAAGSGTTIIDGSVVIGSLAANAQVTPGDTITIRQNISIPFNQAALVWSPAGTPVVASSSSSSITSSSSSSAAPTGPAVNLSWLGAGTLPTGVALYDVDGYAALGTPVTGGGVISEDDPAYRKVYTPAEFIAALDAAKRTLAAPVKVIEIMNDLNLGTLESGVPIAGIYRAQSTQAQLHPTLKLTGVSLIDIKTITGLTIFSRNGATIRHAEWNIKDVTNLMIRNLKFDELWEWDEATKGDYDKNDWDYITLGDGTAANKVWIDHCTFYKSYDGIVDVKGASSGITISWSQILPGDSSNGAFIRAQMDYLEANQANLVMYKKLRDGGLTQDQITQVTNTIKKGHLIGATAKNSDNASLQVTLHHNYYQDLQDRMPRLRGGDVQAFNILADSANARAIKAWLDPILLGSTNLAKDFTGTGSYKFGITSNGTISTEDGVIEVANSLYAGVLTPLRNNQTDVNDASFTGSVVAANTQHELLASEMPIASQQSTFNALGNLWAVWKGDSNFANSTLGPVQAPAKYLSFKAAPPSAKALHAPTALRSVLVTGAEPAGAGKVTLTVPQWLNSLNAGGASSSSASSTHPTSASSSSTASAGASSATSSIASGSSGNSSSVAGGGQSSSNGQSSSGQSSSTGVVASTNLPFVESFDGTTTAGLFTVAYKSLAADASAALFAKTGGSPAINSNALDLAGARLTIGNRPPRTNTTATDTTTNGDFDLSRPYRITFKVLAASGAGTLQVFVDNNTTSSGSSKHGASSRVYSAVASTLTAGQVITITPAVGTSTSFIALRTESTAAATIDDFRIEYLDGESSSSASVSSSASSTSSVASSSSSSSSAPFVQPTQVYNLQSRVTPSVNQVDSHVDTSLAITFDAPPVLGTTGEIHIFKLSDDSLVDTIKLSGNTDEIGYDGQLRVRIVNTQPLHISGNSLIITPHSSKLDYGTAYYVAIANGALTGATVNGVPFVGLGKNAGWIFTTKASAPTSTELTVDDNGTADFRTVQGAINHAMQNVALATPVTITVKNGSYEELLYVRSKNNLTIKGESRDGVVIQYTNNNTLNAGTGGSQAPGATSLTGGRSVLLVEASDMLVIDNLTLKNTTLIGNGGQAEVIYFNNDAGRLVVSNSSFISEQDTVQVKGYSWFYRSLIAGNVDFIWGGNRVALFEESEIRSLGDSRGNGNGGYILQARTVTAADKGFVFLNSRLTRGPGPLGHNIADGQTWLARSGGSASYFDNIVFINTQMDSHIRAAGWYTSPMPNPSVATATSGWREYGSTDLSATTLDISSRNAVSGQLSLGDVISNYCSRAQIFAAFNGGAGWNPLPGDTTDCLNFDMSGSSSSSSAASSVASSSSSSTASSSASNVGSESSSSVQSSSSSSSSASSVAAVVLPQTTNPVYGELTTYKTWLNGNADAAVALAADTTKANNIVSWQMPHGGFYKTPAWYNAPWNGSATRSEWYGAGGVELGTIDNDATVTEILFLADVYARTGNVAYRDSARKALDFLLTMQTASGGFPQVYPARTGTLYSNYVTFNDDAMVRVLVLLDHAAQSKAPLDGDIFTATQRTQLKAAVDKAVGFIVQAQITQAGVKTVWCAQHDPVTFAARGARSYELASKSGKESSLIVAFLMSQPQAPEVKASVQAALAWYRSDAVQLKNVAYEKTNSKATNTTPFIAQAGATTWYRFYDLNTDTGFFSGRLPTDNPPGVGKQYDVMAVETERRYGYEWGGSYGTKLLAYAASVGY